MAQGSRQVQTQAQQQIQTLSPQQILVVKLLELPTVELEERIHSEILDNPALEEGKEMPENEVYQIYFMGYSDYDCLCFCHQQGHGKLGSRGLTKSLQMLV